MSRWDDFVGRVEKEASAEGPEAVAELQAFRDYYRLARQFVERRRELGLTQAGLAELSGIAQSEISRYESGRVNPTFATLSRMCGALGCGLELAVRDEPGGRSTGSRPA